MGETELHSYVKVVSKPGAAQLALFNTIKKLSICRNEVSRDSLAAARGLIKDPTSKIGRAHV